MSYYGAIQPCLQIEEAFNPAQDEQDSQSSYEDFVKQTGTNIKAKQSEVDGKMKEMADAKNDKAEAESNRESAVQELDQLAEAKEALHKEPTTCVNIHCI